MTDINGPPAAIPMHSQPRSNNHRLQEQQPVSPASSNTAELKYYIAQILHIIKPVMMCIALSVLWVKISMAGSDFRPQSNGLISVYQESSGDSGSQVFVGSLTNALAIIGMIIGATLLFVILFKFGCWKILHGYLFLTVVMLLGFMGYLLALNVIQVLSIPVDLITLVFALYNFAVVGIVAVFSTAPLWLQQTYLVLMSSIMAFSLTGLDAWTTWLLLGILAIWDLIAVLCPYGPLRVLVETSQQENREIPALLYSVTMVWMTMATPAADEAITNNSDGGDLSKQKPRAETSAITNDNVRKSTTASPEELIAHPRAPGGDASVQQAEEDEEDESERGLKLGLGDFVFYSVLIARTSMTDWITTFACIVAVITGMNLTIFLLAIYRKALPALPISIAFGIFFYFVSAYSLVPYINYLALSGVVI